MSILDQMAKGQDFMKVTKARTQGASDAMSLQGASQALQIKALQLQSASEQYEVKKRSKKIIQDADLGTIEGTRKASQDAISVGNIELGVQLDKSADDEQQRATVNKLNRDKLNALMSYRKDKATTDKLKLGTKTKFKKASIGEYKSTGALLVNTDDYNGLEKEHRGTYAGSVTQAVSDYMEASRAVSIPVTRLQALESVQQIAASYITEESFLGFNALDSNKFKEGDFIRDFNQILPSLIGYSEASGAPKVDGKAEKVKNDTDSFLNNIVGVEE